jgi:hypothetical protein
MQKIAISNIKEKKANSIMIRDRLYSIYLGNSQIVYFKNIKHAKSYLAQLNSFLNMQLIEINHINIYIFIDYRKMAIIYNEYFLNDNHAQNLILCIDKFFIKSVSQTCSWANRNNFYFLNIQKLIGYLIKLCNVLIRILRKKRSFLYDNSLLCTIDRLNEINHLFEIYGIEDQKNAPKCWYDHKNDEIPEKYRNNG